MQGMEGLPFTLVAPGTGTGGPLPSRTCLPSESVYEQGSRVALAGFGGFGL